MNYLISYPKSGRTWLRFILGKIWQLHYNINCNLDDIPRVTQRKKSPKKIKYTHDKGSNFAQWVGYPRDIQTSKNHYRNHNVIILSRDPRDVVVSSYYHKIYREDCKNFKGSLSEYIRHKKGSLSCIIRFLNIWAQQRKIPKKFMLVRYEDLHNNIFNEINRIINFVQLQNIKDDNIEKAIEFASFKNMQTMEKNNSLKSSILRTRNPDNINYYKVRVGNVGGFKTALSDNDVKYVNDKMKSLDKFYGYNI